MKQSADQLRDALGNFTGTTQYHRLLPTFVVTDGLKYLMEQADCYWLAQLYGLHLVSVSFHDTPFTVMKFKRVGEGAKITIEDGNGGVLEWQGLHYAEFPFDDYSLFACWAGEYWVGMLPSEY